MGGGKVKGYSHDWVQNSIAGYFAVFASFSFFMARKGWKTVFPKASGSRVGGFGQNFKQNNMEGFLVV